MRAAVLIWSLLAAIATAQDVQPRPTGRFVIQKAIVEAPAEAPAEPSAAPATEKPESPPADEATQASGPAVHTIHDERIAAAVAAIEDGHLILATEPPRKISFDEVTRVELANDAKTTADLLAAEWLGQDNHDLVGPGSSPGASGIQDVHIRLTGLALGEEIKQIVAVRRRPSPLRMWRMDTSRSTHGKIGLRRGKGASTADLFLEPDDVDFFQRDLTLSVTYENGARTKVAITASTHTDHQLKFSPESTDPATVDVTSVVGPAVTAHLEGSDLLHGNLTALSEDSATLRTIWEQEVRMPLLEVRGLRFDEVKNDAAQSAFAARLAEPTGEDTALVLSRNNQSAEVAGHCLALADGKLQFQFNEQTRSINADRLIGLVFAAHPPVRSGGLRQIVEFVNGDRISGELLAISDRAIEFQMAHDLRATLPRHAVRRITFVNGRMVYLSDLTPLSVEETPYFGRTWHFQRDTGLEGGPLVMGGQNFEKGLAVHSRCVLSYALDGQYAWFKSRVGFDDTADGHGAVTCRVLADGRELFAAPKLSADADPIDVAVPLDGVAELTLEIDFGPREDTGDRVIWADARILRGEEKPDPR